MSQHPSLKVGGAAEAKRTVLTRYERVELLRKRGELKEDDRITGPVSYTHLRAHQT